MDKLFYVAMAISLCFLGVGLAAPSRPRVVEIGAVFMFIVLFFSCFALFLMPLVIQSILTIVGFPLFGLPSGGARLCRTMAFVGFIAGWGYGTYAQWEKSEAYSELRRDYPIESLESRIAPSQPSTPREPTRYDELEGSIINESQSYFSRSSMLRELHEKQFKWFANSPGFGPVRMIRRGPERRWIERNMDDGSIPQAAPPFDGIESTGDEVALDLYNPFHDSAILGFSSPKNWGYWQGDAYAAGFRSHGFGEKLYPPEKHKLERVELVGMLKHPAPVVYVTANLPRMDELAGVPTRTPDAFEADGIAKIIAGDDLIAKRIGTTVRLLGSIRTLASCLECHTGNKGDLLGAFSYRLTMDGK